MKKIIAAVLMLVMVASLCACKANHSAKYIGTWEDETTNTALILNEDGSAVLRVGTEIYDLGWAAEDYDTIKLTINLPVDDEGNIIEVTETETETEVEETETEAEETETEAEEKPEKQQNSLSTKTKTLLLYTCELNIRKGTLYLSSVDADKEDAYTFEFFVAKQK